MIKKILITLGIFGFLLIGNYSNAYTTLCDSSWSVRSRVIGNIGSYNDVSYSFGGLEYGNFLSEYAGIQKNLIAMSYNMLIWWEDTGLPYIYYGDGYQGNPNTYLTCDEITFIGRDTIYNCSCSNYTTEEIKDFMSVIDSGDYYGYWQNDGMLFCFSSHVLHKTLCFGAMVYDSNGFPINSKGYSSLTFSDIDSNLLFDSPGFGGGDSGGGDSGGLNSGGILLGSSESAILYFESRYGWDESICYAGVDNLTAFYGDSVSFQEGTGLSIFQVFSGLYGNEDLDKIYVWLNSWLINYGQWFERSEPLYLSNYNSGTNQVDLYYTGFTFPFANNPVAIFFLSDNLYNRSTYQTQGSEIVSYCNIKINSGTFEEIIDQSVKDNINANTQLVNINKGLNPDGSRREFDNVGAFLTSGTDLAFSGNTTVKNTLKSFFEDMDQALSVIDIDTSNRILPTWFVTAFLFVVLFKVLRKR